MKFRHTLVPLATLSLVSCGIAAEETGTYTDEEATDYLNENAVGQSSGEIIGETEFRAVSCEGELVLEEGADIECEDRIFHIEEVGENGRLTVSSTYTGG